LRKRKPVTFVDNPEEDALKKNVNEQDEALYAELAPAEDKMDCPIVVRESMSPEVQPVDTVTLALKTLSRA